MRSRRTTIKVSWGHCDPAGIIYSPNYFRWFDACTHGLLEALDLDQRRQQQHYGILGVPLVEAKGNFITPVTYGDVINALTTVGHIGTTSLRLDHAFSKDGQPICAGHEVRVWAGQDAGGNMIGVPIPDEVRALLSAEGEIE